MALRPFQPLQQALTERRLLAQGLKRRGKFRSVPLAHPNGAMHLVGQKWKNDANVRVLRKRRRRKKKPEAAFCDYNKSIDVRVVFRKLEISAGSSLLSGLFQNCSVDARWYVLNPWECKVVMVLWSSVYLSLCESVVLLKHVCLPLLRLFILAERDFCLADELAKRWPCSTYIATDWDSDMRIASMSDLGPGFGLWLWLWVRGLDLTFAQNACIVSSIGPFKLNLGLRLDDLHVKAWDLARQTTGPCLAYNASVILNSGPRPPGHDGDFQT